MDDARLPFEAAVPSLHGAPARQPEGPDDLVPLRLQLQPAGLGIELDKPTMMLGRHSEADIRFALPDISRRHCHFLFRQGHWLVHDLHSLNGVFVNGVRVQEATLCPGDSIRIGSVTFKVQLGAGAAKPEIADILPGPSSLADKRKAS
jgi:pSer/pThr/pTyr-binding forkhead associated (FHA) protein